MCTATKHPRSLPRLAAGPIGLLVAVTSLPAVAAEGGLQIFPDGRTLVVLLILFALLIPLTDRILFRPLLRVLDEREERIAGARGRAVELAAEAKQLLGRYEAALRDAREHADGERKAYLRSARQEQAEALLAARRQSEEELARTRSEVGTAVERARAGLRREAETLAREVATRLLGRGLD